MLLTLYKTLDGDNVINKVLTDPTDFNINLKLDTDLTSPELLMTKVTGVDYAEFNYATSPALGRKYFIRRVVAMNASIFKLICECDYLETFKDDILNSQASFKSKIKGGDFGAIDLDMTGKVKVSEFTSSVALVPDDKAILSVMGGFYGG